jgi:hypothetical protein
VSYRCTGWNPGLVASQELVLRCHRWVSALEVGPPSARAYMALPTQGTGAAPAGLVVTNLLHIGLTDTHRRESAFVWRRVLPGTRRRTFRLHGSASVESRPGCDGLLKPRAIRHDVEAALVVRTRTVVRGAARDRRGCRRAANCGWRRDGGTADRAAWRSYRW